MRSGPSANSPQTFAPREEVQREEEVHEIPIPEAHGDSERVGKRRAPETLDEESRAKLRVRLERHEDGGAPKEERERERKRASEPLEESDEEVLVPSRKRQAMRTVECIFGVGDEDDSEERCAAPTGEWNPIEPGAEWIIYDPLLISQACWSLALLAAAQDCVVHVPSQKIMEY